MDNVLYCYCQRRRRWRQRLEKEQREEQGRRINPVAENNTGEEIYSREPFLPDNVQLGIDHVFPSRYPPSNKGRVPRAHSLLLPFPPSPFRTHVCSGVAIKITENQPQPTRALTKLPNGDPLNWKLRELFMRNGGVLFLIGENTKLQNIAVSNGFEIY